MARRRFSAKALTERLLEFGGKCAICRMKTGGSAGLEWDHRVPLEMGGEDVLENLEPLCTLCHRWKTKNDAGHIAKAKRMQQRESGIPRNPGPQSNLKQYPPTKRYPRGRVEDRRTGKVVWPR